MTRNCPDCGAENNDSAKFCTRCGHGLNVVPPEDMVSCAACGEVNTAWAKYCKKCGERLEPAAAVAAAAAASAAEVEASHVAEAHVTPPPAAAPKAPGAANLAPRDAALPSGMVAAAVVVVVLLAGAATGGWAATTAPRHPHPCRRAGEPAQLRRRWWTPRSGRCRHPAGGLRGGRTPSRP